MVATLLTLLLAAAQAADEVKTCTYDQLRQISVDELAKTQDPAQDALKGAMAPTGKSVRPRRRAADRVFLLRQAIRNCEYWSEKGEKDACADKACKIGVLTRTSFPSLCDGLPDEALHDQCRREAVEAWGIYDQSFSLPTMVKGREVGHHMSDDVAKILSESNRIEKAGSAEKAGPNPDADR